VQLHCQFLPLSGAGAKGNSVLSQPQSPLRLAGKCWFALKSCYVMSLPLQRRHDTICARQLTFRAPALSSCCSGGL
jgi:hypothetical protein